jgi:maleylacetate reductase
MGIQHALAQLLGARTGTPHGQAHASLLAHTVRFNQAAVPSELERIRDALGDGEEPAAAVEAFVRDLGLTARLSDLGVDDEDIDAVVRQSESHPALRANPRPARAEDVRAILEAAF